jgi:argininosuccinate synthase
VYRIVLAHSGGFTTTVATAWLAEARGAEVVTVTVDVGQGLPLADVRESALALGAARAHVVDARDEFVREFVMPSLQAGALHRGTTPLPEALARPLLARTLARIARMEGAGTIAHGGEADGALDEALRTLSPEVEVIAPAREWQASRFDAASYARARGIPLPGRAFASRIDTNLWGRTTWWKAAAGPSDASLEAYALTRQPEASPDLPAHVDVGFERGVPVAVNGIEMPLAELIESLETIAGAHGVGRIDPAGESCEPLRASCEAPAAVVLHLAHRELESAVLTPDLARLKAIAGTAYADVVRSGQWFSRTREALDAFVGAIQPAVTGTVRLELFKGRCRVVERRLRQADRDKPDTVLTRST